ncbi:MAG: hypothetical protein J2P45_17095 [Candidatus Dormibacteraeota bacterium]|nr:hypothetical protein [Candidatus Dormibacteraeota bacterium]
MATGAPPEQLRRGSVCLVHRRRPSEPNTSPELVVLLQDASRAGREEVMAATIHTVTDRERRRAGFYGRLLAGEHPAALLIPPGRVRGSGEELYVGLLAIGSLRRTDVVDHRGSLSDEDMREISERLVKTLELDISRLVKPPLAGEREAARSRLPWWSRREEQGSPS